MERQHERTQSSVAAAAAGSRTTASEGRRRCLRALAGLSLTTLAAAATGGATTVVGSTPGFAAPLLGQPSAVEGPSFPVSELVVVTENGPHRFRVEVARTAEQRMEGLQGRREMAADAGMLFVLDPPTRAAMWMKNTFIALDMVFIDDSGRIVGIREKTEPLSLEVIRAPAPVRAVLELNAGTAQREGLRIGDRVRHPVFGQTP